MSQINLTKLVRECYREICQEHFGQRDLGRLDRQEASTLPNGVRFSEVAPDMITIFLDRSYK